MLLALPPQRGVRDDFDNKSTNFGMRRSLCPNASADFLRVRQKCQPVGQVNDHFYLINICPYFLQNSKNKKKMQAPDMEKKQI
jgi:hypothetical protein